MTLTREGGYVRSSDENVEETNIFEGEFNRITFEQVYTVNISRVQFSNTDTLLQS